MWLPKFLRRKEPEPEQEIYGVIVLIGVDAAKKVEVVEVFDCDDDLEIYCAQQLLRTLDYAWFVRSTDRQQQLVIHTIH